MIIPPILVEDDDDVGGGCCSDDDDDSATFGAVAVAVAATNDDDAAADAAHVPIPLRIPIVFDESNCGTITILSILLVLFSLPMIRYCLSSLLLWLWSIAFAISSLSLKYSLLLNPVVPLFSFFFFRRMCFILC